MIQLDQEIVLVTGASRGIGREVAMRLGGLGATVIGTATSESGAGAISEAFASASVRGAGMVLEVTDQSSIDGLIKSVEGEYGRISVLVNNAGITRDNLLMRMKDEEWEAIMTTNLGSVFRLSRA